MTKSAALARKFAAILPLLDERARRLVVANEARDLGYGGISKIHRASLTGTDLDYEGSIAIDADLLRAADILPGEQVHVLNLSNGERLITYAIAAPAGSGTVLLNGPAARLGLPGDLVIVLSYGAVSEEEARSMQPTVVRVDAKNRRLAKDSS
jgi:aspartate 1-decarboxylase